MKLVITQRSDTCDSYNERRDGLDQSWYPFLRSLFGSKITLFPIPNDVVQATRFLAQIDPDGVVLTGGNDIGQISGAANVWPGRDEVEEALLDHAQLRRLSVLAACRGLQFLNAYAGGRTTPVFGHVAESHELRVNTEMSFIVNSFHNHSIPAEDLAPDLHPLAWDSDGHVEAAHHRNLPWLGVMWHPERTQPDPAAQDWLCRQLKQHTEFLA